MATELKDVAAAVSPVRMEVEDGIAIIRIGQPGRPVNVIAADLVEAMHGVLQRLEGGGQGIRAAVLISGKRGSWIAGADIEQFKDFPTPADGESASREGQKPLNPPRGGGGPPPGGHRRGGPGGG